MLVWGIIGVGRAGRARAAAIQADPRGVVSLGHRGRPQDAGLSEAASLQALLDACDAVAICAPDAVHPGLVRAALAAGCHVLCEYPLAPTMTEAAALLALADQAGRVLHVEHIELLGAAARWWRLQPLEAIRGGVVRFTSQRQDVSVIDGGLARLHRILDILDMPQQLRVEQRSHHHLSATLRWPAHDVALDFRSGAGLPRRTEIELDCALGRCRQVNRSIFVDGAAVELPDGPRLFAADQHAATARILDGGAPYLSRARLLAALALRDELRRVALGSWQAI